MNTYMAGGTDLAHVGAAQIGGLRRVAQYLMPPST